MCSMSICTGDCCSVSESTAIGEPENRPRQEDTRVSRELWAIFKVSFGV